jgi:iron complex transport system substrate-binding protein
MSSRTTKPNTRVSSSSDRRAARAVLLTTLLLLARPAAATPRVVSLNLCTDQLLVLLAPEQATALSPLARDPALSFVAPQAASYPTVRPDAEAVLNLHPGLVLAGTYGAQSVLALLRARGTRIVQIPEPESFAAVTGQVTLVAATLGVPERGATLLAFMRARLAAIPHTPRGTALFWQARGYTAGPGSFDHEILTTAGYTDTGTGTQMPLEALVTHPPHLLVTETAPEYPSLATDLLSHPALSTIPTRTVDPALLACPGPWSVGAVEALGR